MKIAFNGYLYESSDEYDIEKIKRDPNNDYRYVDKILYKINKGAMVEELPIDAIQNTTENNFYPEHISKYVEYIKNGGILLPFPVQISKMAYSLENMLNELDSNKTIEDDAYDEFKDTGIPGLEFFALSDIIIDNDEGEKFQAYGRLNSSARSINECYPQDITEAEKTSLPFLQKVFGFFNDPDHAEYTLINQNHRLEALKQLGIKHVLVQDAN